MDEQHLPPGRVARLGVAAWFAVNATGFLVATWYGLSSLDYSQGDDRCLRTGGWFLFGLVFFVPLAALYAGAAYLSAQRLGSALAACLSMGFTGAWVVSAERSARPQERLERIVGREAVRLVAIQQLRTWDSLNDGWFASGIVQAAPGFFERLQAFRPPVRRQGSPSLILQAFPRYVVSDPAAPVTVLVDEHGWFFPEPGTDLVYFSYRSHQPRERSQ